jgi:hypothetical protein
MKFLKGTRRAQSGENGAFVDRLASITSRGKGEVSSYDDALAAEVALKPQRQQQCFWTPEEAAGAGGA